jgi:hypothetical protein
MRLVRILGWIGIRPGGPARLRRPYCDELGWGPFSFGRRSERPRTGSFGSLAANASRVLAAEAYRLVYDPSLAL